VFVFLSKQIVGFKMCFVYKMRLVLKSTVVANFSNMEMVELTHLYIARCQKLTAISKYCDLL